MGLTKLLRPSPRTRSVAQNNDAAMVRRAPAPSVLELCRDCGMPGPVGIAIGGCGCGGNAGRGRVDIAADSRVAAAAAAAAGNSAASWADAMVPSTGCYPGRGWTDPRSGAATGAYNSALREELSWRPAPYSNVMYDFANMDLLYSEQFTLEPGVATEITVSPVAGTFAGFYYKILVVDPTTQVTVPDWTYQQPNVRGCPQPCDVGASATGILSGWAEQVPESCCGVPLTAWLDRRSEDVPLVVEITNRQAAGNLTGQLQVRGYCCSTRICM